MMMFSTHEMPELWFDPGLYHLTIIDCHGSLFDTVTGEYIARPDVPKPRINGITGDSNNFVGRHRLYEDFHNDDNVRFISDNGNLWRVSEIFSHTGQASVSMPFSRNVNVGPRWERV